MKNVNEVIVSKKVYVRHRPQVVKRDGVEYNDQDSMRYIGSQFKGQEVLRGLDFDEEKKYLKDIVGVSPTSEKWDDATKKYWANIRARVPYGLGLELEIGFKYNDEELSKKGEAKDDYNDRQAYGTPIKLSDYILWRYCLVYGRIANTIAEVNNSNKIRFYLHSKEAEVNDKYIALELKKRAMAKLILITADRSLVDQVLTIFNDPMATQKGDKEKDIALETHMMADPALFIKTIEDPQLKTKALIELAIMKNHLRRVENTDTIIYGDNTPIGNSIDDAVAYLNSPRNLPILNNIKAKLSKLGTVNPIPEEKLPSEEVVVDDLPDLGGEELDNDLVAEVNQITKPIIAETKKEEDNRRIVIKKPVTAS